MVVKDETIRERIFEKSVSNLSRSAAIEFLPHFVAILLAYSKSSLLSHVRISGDRESVLDGWKETLGREEEK